MVALRLLAKVKIRYVKCINAHGTQLEEGGVYELVTEDNLPFIVRMGHEYLKGYSGVGYGSYRFVEATKIELLIAINKGQIKMED